MKKAAGRRIPGHSSAKSDPPLDAAFPFTRFAPSPTGYLHRGHVFSALCVFAAAKEFGYRVRLRIEDHDRSRARNAYIDAIREDLDWLGFPFDAESIQSENGERYERLFERLKAQGFLYACGCSRKSAFENNPVNADGETIYKGHCRDLGLPFEQGFAVRFKTPDKTFGWTDILRGGFTENPREWCGDFAVKDRLGQWTYQFAVVADDLEEGVGLVVRGMDLLHSTSRQIALANALGRKEPPLFLHHGLLLSPEGKKLSKREKAAGIRSERDAGKSAETLLGEVCKDAGLIPRFEPMSVQEAVQLSRQSLFR